jgi:hypothetical protein
MRTAARKDDNQDEIVFALRGIGATVAITHQLGGGFVDIVVGFRGKNYLIEIKDGNKPPSRRKLTKDEADFHWDWQGQIDIAENAEDAFRIIGAIE